MKSIRAMFVSMLAVAIYANAEPPNSKVPGYDLKLRSPLIGADGALPVEFTGDGDGVNPPLTWTRGPKGTKSYAVIMHHVDREGVTKWYWTLYNIPATVTAIPRDNRDIGQVGTNSINGEVGYAPPHSKGPGTKVYTLTLYALSKSLKLAVPNEQVSRNTLLTAMKGAILAQSSLRVTYSRSGD
jgi:Raf kinase inhibitor-like YbhB/YbcL family protein